MQMKVRTKISIHENAMSVDNCARTILKAIANKREVVMTFQGKFGQWGILIAPKVIDEMVRKGTSIDKLN